MYSASALLLYCGGVVGVVVGVELAGVGVEAELLEELELDGVELELELEL